MQSDFARTATALLFVLASGTAAFAQMTNDEARILTSGLTAAVTNCPDAAAELNKVSISLQERTAANTIDATEAAAIQSRIKQIQQLLPKLKSATKTILPMVQALEITKQLNRVMVRLNPSTEIDASSAQSLSSAHANLSTKICSAFDAMLITQEDYGRLQTELATVAGQVASLRAPSSPKQLKLVAGQLQDCNAHFAQVLKMSQTAIADLNQREADIEMRIDIAIRSGNIDANSSSSLRKQLDGITALQSNFLTGSTGPLSISQIFTIAKQLDQLQSALDRATSAPSSSAGLIPFTPRSGK